MPFYGKARRVLSASIVNRAPLRSSIIGGRHSFITGLVLGLVCSFLLTGASGCNTGGLRSLDAVNAEQQSLTATKPFAATHVAAHPDEKQSVDDFYASWQGRIDKEKKAAAAP